MRESGFGRTDTSGGPRKEGRPVLDPELAVEVAALTAELQRIREERNSAWTFYASLAGVTVVAGGGFLALNDRELAGSTGAEAWIWAAFAMIPPVIAAFLVWTTAHEVMQSYYMREVERRLAALWSADPGTPPMDDLPPAVLETVNAALGSNRRGLWQLRFLYAVVMLVLGSILLVGSLVAAQRIEIQALRWLITAAVVAISGVTASLGYRLMARGDDLWDRVRARALDDLRSSFPRRREMRDERRLVSYLLIPRPNDLVIKGVLLHLLAALVGGWLARDHTDWGQVLRFAAVSFGSFELLMYQARYMVNDLRGQDDDRRSPARGKRRRLPDLEPESAARKPRRNAVKVTIAVRAIAAAALTLAVPGWWRIGLLGALLGTWVLAAAYETLRDQPRRHGPQRSPGLAFNGWTVQIYAVVGVSYATRAAFGLYLGSDGLISGALTVAVAVTFYLSGMTTVLMTWVLETALYAGRQAGREVVSQEIGTKDHLLPLARSAGLLPPSVSVLQDHDLELTKDERPYHDRRVLITAGRLSQPWNWVFVFASAAAAATGWLGHDEAGPPPPLLPALAAAVIGAAVGLTCVRQPAAAAAAVLATFSGWTAWLWQSGSGFDALFGLFPLTVVVLTYVVTRQMTYDQTVNLVGELRAQLKAVRRRVSHVVREIWR